MSVTRARNVTFTRDSRDPTCVSLFLFLSVSIFDKIVRVIYRETFNIKRRREFRPTARWNRRVWTLDCTDTFPFGGTCFVVLSFLIPERNRARKKGDSHIRFYIYIYICILKTHMCEKTDDDVLLSRNFNLTLDLKFLTYVYFKGSMYVWYIWKLKSYLASLECRKIWKMPL